MRAVGRRTERSRYPRVNCDDGSREAHDSHNMSTQTLSCLCGSTKGARRLNVYSLIFSSKTRRVSRESRRLQKVIKIVH